jgi:hypothetical protein
MVQSQGNQAEVQGYAHYVNLSFNRGNFTHKIGLDPENILSRKGIISTNVAA